MKSKKSINSSSQSKKNILSNQVFQHRLINLSFKRKKQFEKKTISLKSVVNNYGPNICNQTVGEIRRLFTRQYPSRKIQSNLSNASKYERVNSIQNQSNFGSKSLKKEERRKSTISYTSNYQKAKYKQEIFQNPNRIKYLLERSCLPLRAAPINRNHMKTKYGWVSQKRQNLQQKYMNISSVSDNTSIILNKFRNEWLDILQHLIRQIQQLSINNNLFSGQFWGFLIQKFEKYHINSDQKKQFLQLISKFFEPSFGQLKVKNEFQFFGQMGSKFHQLENRIYFKHKQCLQFMKFVIEIINHNQKFYNVHFTQLNFGMDEDELIQVSIIVRSFCQNNMDAFAFLTMYFQICLRNRINKYNAKEVQELFMKRLAKLQELYPANQQQDTITNKANELVEIISLPQSYEVFQFKQSQLSHYQQLKQEIIKKAQKAIEQQSLFRLLIQDLCYKYGYSFKTGIKIKSKDKKSSIFRTIQKLMSKKKYEKIFQDFKMQLKQKYFEFDNFYEEKIDFQINAVQKKIQQILKNQDRIMLDIKDLLRGKCTFTKTEELIETVKNLKSHIEAKGHKIIQIKNRLYKNTKDIVLIIKLPYSIAQLQLVLKLDAVSNQFNHKIYELTRSKMHTPITNLYIHNQKWSETFFTEQIQLFEEVLNMYPEPELNQPATFKRFKKDLTNFKNKYLDANQIKYQKKFQAKRQQSKKVQLKVQETKRVIELAPQSINLLKINQEKIENQINFYRYFDLNKAKNSLEAFEESYLLKNLKLLKLKGDVLNDLGFLDQSLRCYVLFIQMKKQSKQNNSLTDKNLADVLHKLGDVYNRKEEYQQALQYYEKSLQIRENIQKESLDVAISFSGMGSVCMNIKHYNKALQYYQSSLELRQKLMGKQSIDAASSLSCIGQVYFEQGFFQKALQNHKNSLQIKQKIKGKDSVDAASSHYSVGKINHKKQDNGKALQSHMKALEIREKVFGKQNLDVAQSYYQLSFVYQSLGEYKKAKQSIEKSRFIRSKILGKDHSKTIEALAQQNDLNQKIEKLQPRNFRQYFAYSLVR